MNQAIFPAQPSSYTINDFTGELFWVPRKDYNNDNIRNENISQTENSVPCLIKRCPGSRVYLLYCHGNACDIGQMRSEMYLYASRFKVNAVAIEYQGYGISKGSPSADLINQDVRLVYDFFVKYLNVKPENIICFGRSIGTGVATKLVYDLNKEGTIIGALILQSAYLSIRHIAKNIFGFFGNFSPKVFDNEYYIQNVLVPILFIHGERDTLIPPEHSKVQI